MKRFIVIIMLCLTVVNPVHAGKSYNNNYFRALPFIQMMIAMMNFMDTFMNGNKYYSPGMNSFGTFPYSPIPGSGFGNFSANPMSPLLSGQSMFNPQSMFNKTSTDSHDNSVEANDDSKPALNANTSMNGIWQALSGDIIAIYHSNHFIWSDGNSRNLAGRLIIRGNLLSAYIPARKVTLQFQFYREQGQFVVRDKNGKIYTFKRIH